MSILDREDATFCVVLNHEEQHSIWPTTQAIPAGWREAGKIGSKRECLEYIEQHWTDMRPLSLRRKMAADGREQD